MTKKSFPAKLADFVIKYRWPIIIGNIILLAAVMMGTVARIKSTVEYSSYLQEVRANPLTTRIAPPKPTPIMDFDYRVFFRENDPDLVAFDQFQKTYGKENSALILVKAKSGSLFTNENLKSLKDLTEQCWAVPYANGVQGLTNFNYTSVDGNDLRVENFISELPLSPEAIAQKKALAFADPLMPKFLFSKDGSASLISIRIVAPEGFPQANLEVKAALDSIVAEICKSNPNIETHLGGTVILNTAFAEFGNKDFSTVVPFMYLIVMVILFVMFRSIWGVMLPMFVLISSVMFPILLYVGCLNFSLTSISMNVMNIMVSIALAETIHLLHVFFRALHSGMSKQDAIRDTLTRNFNAVLFTSVTTAVGFYATLWVDIPPFNDLGYFAGMGTIYAFGASVLTVPALLAVLPIRVKVRGQQFEGVPFNPASYDWLLIPVARFKKQIAIAAVVVAVLAIVFTFQIRIDDSTIEYFSKNSEFRKSTEALDKDLIGVNVLEFNFDAGKPQGINSPEYLKKIERFQEYLQSHPEYQISLSTGITDVIKRIHMTMNGDQKAYYRLPDHDSVRGPGDTVFANNLVAQYLLLYNMSLPQGVDLNNQVNLDNSQSRVTAFMRSKSSWQLLENVDSINVWLTREMPEVHARAMGVPVMFGHLSKLAIPGTIISLASSLVFIFLCMVFVFRSVKIGLWSMIPNVIPILVVFGGTGMLHIAMNLSIAVVGEITLGIIVDDTIHYITKYQNYFKKLKDPFQALRYSFADGGDALVSNTIILVMGFSSLMFSDFMPTRILGILAVLIIALGLVTEFLLMPVCILIFASKQENLPSAASFIADDTESDELGIEPGNV